MPKYRDMVERIMTNSYHDSETGCWVWLGKVNSKGYPQLTVRNKIKRHPVNVYVHRLVMVVLVGENIDGMEVDHGCKNIRCINPSHLEVVTKEVNLSRRNT